MKKPSLKWLLPLMLLPVLLTGCSVLQKEYVSVKPHKTTQIQLPDAVEVTSEKELKDAILQVVRAGAEEAVIRTKDYGGDPQKDLPLLIRNVMRQEPIGVYAVDYMDYNCTRIVNYYEIDLTTRFKHTSAEISAVKLLEDNEAVEQQIEQTLRSFGTRLTYQISPYRDAQIPQLVEKFCNTAPDMFVEVPKVTVNVYPDSGATRIVEVIFDYRHTLQELKQIRQEIAESIDSAAEYIRYQNSESGKLTLLYSYLLKRFDYTAGQTDTPVYSALCQGIADPRGLSQAWQLICKEAQMDCVTVEGLLDGEPYYWNILSVDGAYRHLDLYRSITEENLQLSTDWAMSRYVWDKELYPACTAVQQEITVAEEPAEEETT